ncbi:MAG: hypothetical protein VXW65_01495 [Pseudomonadota bacterium]|nr:hypothetical protein [Pseudomonadota bacterium]
MTQQQPNAHMTAPETILLSADVMGSHAAHWQALSSDPQADVPAWLQQAVDDAMLPRGLCPADQALPSTHWLIQGPSSAIKVHQIIDVNSQDQPTGLRSAFPYIDSPYWQDVSIQRIGYCPETLEAVLQVETAQGIRIHGFDSLYAVNANYYQANQSYQACFSALAYQLEKVPAHEQMLVEDPAAIRHHRALNAILAANNGIAPDDLQAQMEAWQPSSPDDEAPVTLDLSKMAAYLFGEQFGQEDEAWFQGEILGAQTTDFLGQQVQLLDVAMLREANALPLVVRIACAAHRLEGQIFEVGDYIRGNIWMQIAIYAMSEPPTST